MDFEEDEAAAGDEAEEARIRQRYHRQPRPSLPVIPVVGPLAPQQDSVETVVDAAEGAVADDVIVVGPDGVPWRKKHKMQQRRPTGAGLGFRDIVAQAAKKRQAEKETERAEKARLQALVASMSTGPLPGAAATTGNDGDEEKAMDADWLTSAAALRKAELMIRRQSTFSGRKKGRRISSCYVNEEGRFGN